MMYNFLYICSIKLNRGTAEQDSLGEGDLDISSLLYAEVYFFTMALVLLILVWYRRGSDNSTSARWYTSTLTFFILSFASNGIWGIVHYAARGPRFLAAQYILKILFFIFLDLAAFAWCGYSETEQGNKEINVEDNRRILFMPILIMIMMAISTPYSEVLFTFDSLGNYEHKYMFHANMALLCLYTGVTGVRMLAKASYETDPTKKGQMKQIGLFFTSFLLSWAGSGIFGERFPVINIFTSLWLFYSYVGSTSEQVSVDKLTQIHNRQNLLSYITAKIQHHEERLFLLMMDIDYFKKINDTYGHTEGDQALIRMANALKSSCDGMRHRPYLARYGGDEFIVVVEASSTAEIDGLCETIRKKLEYYNTWSEKQYVMSISIGYAEYQPGMDQKAFINAADEVLYKVKEEHHRKIDAGEVPGVLPGGGRR